MTRINLVDPSELMDQHLIAEYREIRLLCANLKRTLNSKHGFQPKKVPSKFTLNSGHVYFFYNKGAYIHKRYEQLKEEMRNRKFDPNTISPLKSGLNICITIGFPVKRIDTSYGSVSINE